jgi:hypothetical protein
VPGLMGVINRKQIFGGRKLARMKTLAVQALSLVEHRSAKDALTAIANGRDTELASLAREILAAAAPRSAE